MNEQGQQSGILQQGLRIQRMFTQPTISPFDQVVYEKRTSTIRNPDGSIVAEMKDIEVPVSWSQVATDILAQKYIRKKGVPLFDDAGNPVLDESGKQVLGSEKSIKQVARRLAGCWRFWGETHGYFASKEDANTFEAEMQYMILHQAGAPNSPQWFNTGLHWAYGISGPAQGHFFYNDITRQVELGRDAYTRPQPHACFIQSVSDNLVNDGGIFDLATKEARLFKYGSGTGSNFSGLRGEGETLSGGGKSSGLMSWLKIFNTAAGAIKSGGTTRRAAKMVCLDLDHPEIEKFIDWKVIEEQKVADLVAGSKLCNYHLNNVMQIAQENPDVTSNVQLAQAIKEAAKLHVPVTYIFRVLQLVKQGKTSIDFSEFDTHFESEAYETVSGQNSNNSVRIPNTFMQAVAQEGDWKLINRTDGKTRKTLKATDLWDKICFAAWSCADPGVQYDTTINEWHTCPEGGRINASNPCSEYMFLDDTACNLASINLVKFLNEDMTFNVNKYLHAVKLWTITLEISVLMAQFPSKPVAELSYKYRTLGLGYANIGSMLMRMGIAYDSDKGRAICGALTAMLTGKSYETSADLAQVLGPFEKYPQNKEHMLRVIRNHRYAAYNIDKYEGLSVKPMGIDANLCPEYMLSAARQCWDNALLKGEKHGYRNAQTTVLAPTGTIGLVMDCDTTGVEPDFALVKFKKLAGGGYFKIVNQSVPIALKTLGYSPQAIEEIVRYCVGHGTLDGCPHINATSLLAKGIDNATLQKVEEQLDNAFDLKFVFNKYTIGEELLSKLGFSKEQIADPGLSILHELGFNDEEIAQANMYVCGTMTVEGAPGLQEQHLPIFDCANKCGALGKRFIEYMGHIKVMAAAQPFLSGAISKTINMDNSASIDDIAHAYREAWRLMVKAVALYRDGSKLSQPLNTVSGEADQISAIIEDDTIGVEQVQQNIGKRVLPSQRKGTVQDINVGGHQMMVRTGEYDDGSLGDVQIDMHKRGSAYGELMNAFAQAVSLGLQHGVPLDAYVDKFTFTKFEPNGMVNGHPNIKNATSPVDFLLRSLAHSYLGREDLVHIKDEPVQTASAQPAKKVSDADVKRAEAQGKGYTGESCTNCSSMKMKRNGTCSVCEDCGTTTGCS